MGSWMSSRRLRRLDTTLVQVTKTDTSDREPMTLEEAEEEEDGNEDDDLDALASHSCAVCTSACYPSQTEKPAEPITFQMVLHCVPEKTVETKTLELNKFPERAICLKHGIQEQMQVPVCCQRLMLDNIPLEDSDELQACRMRNGDTLHVFFNSEADVQDILEVIATMKLMKPYIRSLLPALASSSMNISQKLQSDLRECIKYSLVENLATQYFFPNSSERAKANQLLFVHNRGMEVMYRLHKTLLILTWAHMPIEMQYLEHAILQTLLRITASRAVRPMILQCRTIRLISQSMLRVSVHPDRIIAAPHFPLAYIQSYGGPVQMDRTVSEVVFMAIGALCNLAEFPKCCLKIASGWRTINQFVAAMLTPTYEYIASLMIVSGFLCLAYSPETHSYLIRPEVLAGVMHASKMQRTWYQITEDEMRLDCLLLSYFASMLFAQLVTASSHLISLDQLKKISQFMREFLSSADYNKIRDHEVKTGFFWLTIVPYVKVAYFPYLNPKCTCTRSAKNLRDMQEMRELEQLCIEAGIFSLLNMLGVDSVRELLVREELVEYVMCLPWNMREGTRAHTRASELIGNLHHQMQLEPPRLQTIVRAKLAAMHFGLEKVYSTPSVHELLSEVYV